MDLVTREEFEAVQAMAGKARAEQERLEQRLAALEATLAEVGAGQGSRREGARCPSRRTGLLLRGIRGGRLSPRANFEIPVASRIPSLAR